MKRTILISGLALGLAFGGTALAEQPGEPGYKDRGERSGMMERWARHLDLTETQQEQLKATRDSYNPELRNLYSEIREQRHALRDSASDGFNEEAARDSAERLGQLMAEHAFLRARLQADIGEILTDEQLAVLAERRQARAERGGNRWRGKGRHGERHNG